MTGASIRSAPIRAPSALGCAPSPTLPEPQADYAYLLGLYLGDGCISLAGAKGKEVWNFVSHARMPGLAFGASASGP